MLLPQARIRVARYRELIAVKPLANEEPPEPLEVRCPECGDLYVVDMEPYEPAELEAVDWEGEKTLAAVCPDHPHFFEVG